jgi:hypothetical protein
MEMTGQVHVPANLPQGNIFDTHGIGSWVGPRSGLDMVVMRKIY